RRVVVFLGVVLLLFLENGENAARGGVAFRAGADGRAADENAIAVNVHDLLRNAHQHHKWAARRKFRIPPVFARFQRASRSSGWSTFGVRGRFFDRRRGGDQSSGEGEDGDEFHEGFGKECGGM